MTDFFISLLKSKVNTLITILDYLLQCGLVKHHSYTIINQILPIIFHIMQL